MSYNPREIWSDFVCFVDKVDLLCDIKFWAQCCVCVGVVVVLVVVFFPDEFQVVTYIYD